MAKINLITIHWGESCGAVLQTYATYTLLENLGHEVTLINLVHKQFRDRFFKWRTYIGIRRIAGYSQFKRKYLGKMTPLMYNINLKKIPKADYTIVGSDQVWNKDITTYLSFSYFLNFAQPDSIRLSLSSSFSKKDWTETTEYTEKVKNELEKFATISVREKSGIQICKNTFGLDAVQLVDPTIALGDFSDFVKGCKEENVVGCFRFIDNELFNITLYQISQKLSAPVRYLRYYNTKDKGTKVACNTPDSWLREIAKSSFIITDSFHGVVFSILLKKRFIALRAIPERFERIESLLNILHLQDRIILSEEDLQDRIEQCIKPIDFHEVDSILQEKKLEYIDFIKNYIK